MDGRSAKRVRRESERGRAVIARKVKRKRRAAARRPAARQRRDSSGMDERTPVPYPTPRGDARAADGWLPAMVWVASVWLATRVALTVVGVLAREWIGPLPTIGNVQMHFGVGTGQAWLDIWGAWDARWYHHVAEVGYQAGQDSDGQANYAFFPLYPWLARFAGALLGSSYLGGLLVSNAAILTGAYVLYRWVEFEKDPETAQKAVLFLFLFPTAYVFSCMMSEGLFIALTIGCWYYARRGNWPVAAALGGLSAMTRPLGVLTAGLLAWEYLRQRQFRVRLPLVPRIVWSDLTAAVDRRVFWLCLVPAGLAVFMGVCWQVAGSPLAFAEIQAEWHDDTWVNPVLVLYRSLTAWSNDGSFGLLNGTTALVYGASLTISVLAVLVVARRQIGLPLLLWSLAHVLVSLSSSYRSPLSMPRLLVVLFPLAVVFAALPTRRAPFWMVAVMLAALQATTLALWTNAYPIAI